MAEPIHSRTGRLAHNTLATLSFDRGVSRLPCNGRYARVVKASLVCFAVALLSAGCHSPEQQRECRGKYTELAQHGVIPVVDSHRNQSTKDALNLELAESFGWRAMTPKEAYEACLRGEL